jgi:glycosyltransferase involved in cell wall biosynthesis
MAVARAPVDIPNAESTALVQPGSAKPDQEKTTMVKAVSAVPRDRIRRGRRLPLTGVLVAIPAYNEERFIGSVVLQARRAGLSVLVIDDGSSDQTAEVAEAAGAFVERHPENRGKAEALNTAFRYARTSGAPALVVLDGDGQHNVAEIQRLLDPILSGEADIAIGSRFLAESPGSIPRVRRFGQKAMTAVTNACSGAAVTDSQSGFRAFSRKAIETLLFSAKGFNVEVEMQFWASEHGLRLVEVPITAVYLDPPKRNVLGHGLHILNGVLSLVGRRRPLLSFGVPGMIVLIVGLVFGIMVTQIYQSTHVLAVGYSLLTVLCTITGLLSIFTGLLLHSVRGTFIDLEKRIIDLASASSFGHQRVR